MYVSFNNIPDHSRIWIYQASRKLTEQERQRATDFLKDFCDRWTAHQQELKTSFSIEYDQFIILAADEDYHQPSGCSIDSSVRALKELQDQLGVDFFDRTRVAFLVNDQVITQPLAGLKAVFESGGLASDSLTFDNLVPSRGDLTRRWKTPVEKTWLAKYLPNTALTFKKS